MKRARLLSGALLLAMMPLFGFAAAQTNADTSASPSADTAQAIPAGPVVMPPGGPAQAAPDSGDTNAPAANAGAAAPSALPGSPAMAKQDEIYDIRPPLFFLRSWFWLWVALGVLAAVALLALLWKWVRSRLCVSPKTAYDLALEKLERARELMREDDPEPYAVAVSEAIRTYLGQRFQATSSRRTTEEFLRQMQDDPSTPLAEHRDLLGAFLRACDLVKFARYQPRLAELEEVQQRAVGFVQATKPDAAAEEKHARLAPVPAHP